MLCLHMLLGYVDFVWRQLEQCVFCAQLRLRIFCFLEDVENEKNAQQTLVIISGSRDALRCIAHRRIVGNRLYVTS